jgi:hypothetical protein
VAKVLWLMAVAFVLVWAGALLDFGGAHDAPRGAPPAETDGAAASAEQPPMPVRAPRPAEHPSASPRPQTGATPSGLPRPAPGSAHARPPGQGDVAVIGSRPAVAAVPGAVAPAAEGTAAGEDPLRGELGEGVISPEYAEIEQGYVNEARDGVWAMAEEQRIRAVLSGSAVSPQVALVHCQQTVCRVVLETDSPDAFQQLVQVPGFTAATGVGPSTPYSLRGGQLSVYFDGRREDATAARK